jgi:site-specific DNA-methyltransferase (adenine-specific)
MAGINYINENEYSRPLKFVSDRIELNKIYNESNLDTMARMPDNFVDLTVTSPPYDGLRTYNGYSFPFEDIAKELFRVTKQGGVLVWIVGDATKNGSESGTSFRQALYFMDVGFNLHDTMIYSSRKPPLTHNRYEQEFEYMFVFSKGRPNTFNPIKIKTNFAGDVKKFNHGKITDAKKEKGDAVRWRDEKLTVNETRIKGNIWDYATGMNGSSKDELAFLHPAIFPERLAEDHIVSWSNEGDIVYDCFGGSGTTAKMAHKWKRQWILSEISKEYVELAEKRIAPYLAQTSLF